MPFSAPVSGLAVKLGDRDDGVSYEGTETDVVMRHKSVGYRHWPLALRLNARGRKLLAARGRLRITVRIDERYEVGYGASHERFRTDLVQPM